MNVYLEWKSGRGSRSCGIGGDGGVAKSLPGRATPASRCKQRLPTTTRYRRRPVIPDGLQSEVASGKRHGGGVGANSILAVDRPQRARISRRFTGEDEAHAPVSAAATSRQGQTEPGGHKPNSYASGERTQESGGNEHSVWTGNH